MKSTISKELLSEVLRMGGTLQMHPIRENNMIGYLVYGSQNTVAEVHSNHKRINIYELAHKCKEWALSEGWYLNAYFTKNEEAYCNAIKPPLNEEVHTEATTEPEAIFKACQWILDKLTKETK